MGPPDTPIVGTSTLDAPMSKAGVVLSQPISSTTPSIHAGEVAVEHRGRPQQRLAQGHHRELEREAAGLEHAVLHVLGDRAEVRIAGRELRIGIADADDGPAVELVVGNAAVLQPRAIDVAHLALAPEPLGAAAFFWRRHAKTLLVAQVTGAAL